MTTLATIAVLALIVAAICLPVTREVRALRAARLRLEALMPGDGSSDTPIGDDAWAAVLVMRARLAADAMEEAS